MKSNNDTIGFYDLNIEKRSNHFYSFFRGNGNFEGLKSYWRSLAHECRARQIKKILVEADCFHENSGIFFETEKTPVSFSYIEIYQLAEYVSNLDFCGVKIAFVTNHADRHETNRFAELVATNRGLNGKIFYDTDEARSWLV